MEARARKGILLGGVILFQIAFWTQAPGMGRPGDGKDRFEVMRKEMVETQLRSRDIRDPKVLEVMAKVPREEFVPVPLRSRAYEDGPLPIGHEQTISQPYIVGYMTQALDLSPTDRVLEIGTGSGYQTAVLAELAGEVYSLELLEPLAKNAGELLAKLGYRNVTVKTGDGYKGWPEKAPFDAMIVTAAPGEIPEALVRQLKDPGGRMIVPVGTAFQELILIEKTAGGTKTTPLLPVRFVPMIKPGEERS